MGRVGYSLPRVVSVKRASRILSLQEVETAIGRYLKESGSGAVVRNIGYRGDVEIPPGNADIQAVPFLTKEQGQMGFDIKVRVDDIEEARFNVSAGVEDWREVPVAARTLSKGTLVGPEDVRMARLNVHALPGDVALSDSGIIGKEVSREVPQGDFFKEGRLSVPPVITTGQPVTLRYRIKSLEATATGLALEAGVKGQEIRVRNAASKKVLTGAVIEAGLVEVRGPTAGN